MLVNIVSFLAANSHDSFKLFLVQKRLDIDKRSNNSNPFYGFFNEATCSQRLPIFCIETTPTLLINSTYLSLGSVSFVLFREMY